MPGWYSNTRKGILPFYIFFQFFNKIGKFTFCQSGNSLDSRTNKKICKINPYYIKGAISRMAFYTRAISDPSSSSFYCIFVQTLLRNIIHNLFNIFFIRKKYYRIGLLNLTKYLFAKFFTESFFGNTQPNVKVGH